MDSDSDLRGGDGESEEPASITPRDALTFLARSAKRHSKLACTVAGSVASIGILVALIIPSRFESESRILAVQSALVTSALSNPNRPVRETDPFGGSTEMLMKKSNLLWMTREADLLSSWKKTRPLPLRWKDTIFSYLSGPGSNEGRVKALAEMLEKQMYVFHDQNVLTIHVTWQDPDAVLKIAQLAQSGFLKLRKEQELAAITAAINVNENEVKQAAEVVDQTLQELIRIKEARRLRGADAPVAAAAPGDAGTQAATESAAKGRAAPSKSRPVDETESAGNELHEKQLSARLAELRQQEHEIENPWQRKVAELKYQLNDLRVTYGPEHPQILAQEAKIQQASQRPPELVTLKNQEQELLSEIEAATFAENAHHDQSKPVTRSSPSVRAIDDNPHPMARTRALSPDGTIVIAEKEEDPTISPAKANLTAAISRYAEATKRLDTAHLELTTSQASLEYRYNVVAEPERPAKASKPNRSLLVLGALAVAGVLGLLAGAIRDLLTGKIFEPWQVKILGLPIVGELNLTRRAKP